MNVPHLQAYWTHSVCSEDPAGTFMDTKDPAEVLEEVVDEVAREVEDAKVVNMGYEISPSKE